MHGLKDCAAQKLQTNINSLRKGQLLQTFQIYAGARMFYIYKPTFSI